MQLTQINIIVSRYIQYVKIDGQVCWIIQEDLPSVFVLGRPHPLFSSDESRSENISYIVLHDFSVTNKSLSALKYQVNKPLHSLSRSPRPRGLFFLLFFNFKQLFLSFSAFLATGKLYFGSLKAEMDGWMDEWMLNKVGQRVLCWGLMPYAVFELSVSRKQKKLKSDDRKSLNTNKANVYQEQNRASLPVLFELCMLRVTYIPKKIQFWGGHLVISQRHVTVLQLELVQASSNMLRLRNCITFLAGC